ncbi:unnamed protein product [Didymodactylos carnosus]|uniref:Methyltransferase domain-containing protein n=1 Tax=Didymodactylos carnosus TaxID=1234261 RepID=A0A814JVG3_9BILA|nr:unnamed protein product [Didymodactylos carnosus]CAF1043106.1 unnamed protein product [Didymodactylos carnosus]CAF3760984.1 unnamed protein product [Didymodactylos carnosus]CAF3813230.1 unnamed protein product [Didymodactylos carnosus]
MPVLQTCNRYRKILHSSPVYFDSNELLHTELSPQLKWCVKNPFLNDYNQKEVYDIELKWFEWKENEMTRTYDVLLEYAQSDGTAVHLITKLFYPINMSLTCPNNELKRYGSSLDTGKLLCDIKQLKNDSCIIYSLGSNNEFDFEKSLAEQTHCQIYTFDCTSLPPKIPIHRLTFKKICLENGIQQYMYPNQSSLGTKPSKRFEQILLDNKHEMLHVLKMDIEASEYSVFADLFKNKIFPYQIAFESHWWHRDIYHAMLQQQVFNQLWKTGYRFLQYAHNPGDQACVEWTLIRLYC